MVAMQGLDPDDTRPPYAQVVDAIRQGIERGELPPGSKLPSHQELVDHFGVSVGTVKRALGELQGAGLVLSRQGQGAFVRTRLPDARAGDRPGADEDLRRVVADLAARVDALERRWQTE